MKRRRSLGFAALIGLVVAAASYGGCVSLRRTPGARLFVLRSVVAPPAGAETPAGGQTIGVLPVRIPGGLDRPQLVAWAGPNELRLDEFARWAEPLDEGATRVLVENLAALRPRDRVLRSPWPAALAPRCRIATELRVFGLQADGTVRIEGRVVLLTGKEERVLSRRAFASSRGPLAGRSSAAEPGASVDAMSDLLADLAKDVAAAIAGLP